MWISYLLIALLGGAFAAIVITGIRNRRLGKHSCACGGNCAACALCEKKDTDELPKS
jgi:hypothetical protein